MTFDTFNSAPLCLDALLVLRRRPRVIFSDLLSYDVTSMHCLIYSTACMKSARSQSKQTTLTLALSKHHLDNGRPKRTTLCSPWPQRQHNGQAY
jgi:hypothetical protein